MKEALKLALKFVEDSECGTADLEAALKEALAQPERDGKCKYCTDGCAACDARKLPEQEPVAWMFQHDETGRMNYVGNDGIHPTMFLEMNPRYALVCPLYTTPPQREWELIETAPKDGTDVLVMYVHIDTQVVHNGFWIGTDDTDNESEIGWWSYEHSEVSRIKLDCWMTPTHWLPLPELKEKNNG